MRHSCNGLKKGSVAIAISFLSCFIFFNMSASGELLQPHDRMPDIQLPVPQNDVHKNYLGLTQSGTFFLDEINARFLIIEMYTMY